MNLHEFGLQGVQRPSYYESHPGAIREAAAKFDIRARLLEKAPNLNLLVASDPANQAQAVAKAEVLAIIEAATQLRGGWP